jgi:hypothetical protein
MAQLLLICHKFMTSPNCTKLRVKQALGWNRVPTKLCENRSGTSSVAMETRLDDCVLVTLVATARNLNVQKLEVTEQSLLTQTFVNVWHLFSMCFVILRDKLCGRIVKTLCIVFAGPIFLAGFSHLRDGREPWQRLWPYSSTFLLTAT